MAAIGSIRKHGVALLIIIGLAMLAFIVGDLTPVKQAFFNKNIMTRIDGKKMDNIYNEQYNQNTALMRLMQQKSSFNEAETYQIHEMTWNQMLQDQAIDKQLKSLGLVYTDQMIEDFKDDMIASLNTQRPNQFMMQFANALAQMYGPENAMAILTNIEEYANNDQVKDLYNAYQAIVRFALSSEKYSHYAALIQGSVYFSDPLAKQIAKSNKTALVSIMPINPEMAAFNGIKAEVSEKEMKDFYKAHKNDLYTLDAQNRDIDVAIFPILPTNEDLKAIEDSVRADYNRFSQTASLLEFSVSKGNGTVDSTYYKEDDITLDTLKNLIFKTPVGSFIEPMMYENVQWYFGKVFGGASRPDSVQVASIELPFKTKQNPDAKYSKKQAKALADSLQNVIKSNSASIFDLQKNFIERENADTTFWLPERGTIPTLYNDLLATANGGVYVYSAPGGYIVFQVMDRTASIEKRQFVLYNYDIAASDATVSKIKAKANQFVSSITSAEGLMKRAAKEGIQTVQGSAVPSMSSSIGQLPNCRPIVSWAFNSDSKVDAISDVFNIERNFFAVAAVRNIRETGVQKYKEVKDDIKTQLASEKKAAMIAEKLQNDLKGTSMETMAQTYGSHVMDSVSLHFLGDIYMNSGMDSKSVGQVFALPTNTPSAIASKNMVYVTNVKSVTTNQVSPTLNDEKNALFNLVLGRDRTPETVINNLIKQSKVVDNRYRMYQN